MARLSATLMLAACLGSGSSAAAIITYTQSDTSCTGCRALGYPVPIPVASQTAVAGFRQYDSLLAGLQARALANPAIVEQTIGQTINGRNISAFVLGDADNTTAEGLIREGAVLQNGGIHAREWATPEVLAEILEQLDEGATDGGFHQYLLENLGAVLIPVLNVDGFLQTQRYASTALETENAGDPANDPDYPRDGRMRRKNMRDVDETLDVGADGMFGVDLNRNNPPVWAQSSRSSSNARSIVYHGSGAASEPETQALQSAANLGPADRLRLYIDTHSFSRIYFAAYTNNSARNRIQDQLAAVMRTVPATDYAYGPSGPGGEIGSTDEYFAYTYEIPSYTLEVEPGPNGASEYGGRGISHDGFVLPEQQITRVRDELAAASLLGYYRQSGPPVMTDQRLYAPGGGAAIAESAWRPTTPTLRSLSNPTMPASLQSGQAYTLELDFNKPMRHREAGGNVANYPGQSVALAPQIQVTATDTNGASIPVTVGAGSWQRINNSRYQDDRFQLSLTPVCSTSTRQIGSLRVSVSTQDLSGLGLDAEPATVADWQSGRWAGYENAQGLDSDTGGSDASHSLIPAGSAVPLLAASSCAASGGGGGGGGVLPVPTLCLLTLLLALRRRAYRLRA